MKIIGVMTGNSLDGCDAVLTEFSNQKMKDIAFFSQDIPVLLQKDILSLKEMIKNKTLLSQDLPNNEFFLKVHKAYIQWIASCIREFLFSVHLTEKDIDLVGFHGQTLDHNPPSVATEKEPPYTLQMGSGKMLSSLINIPVVYDFRSDDIFNQGEGAPLIPPHNEHFAKMLHLKNAFFYNAGNTSNVALIQNGKVVLGFDSGPFNEFSDKLVRLYKNISYDKDCFFGKQGKLRPDLLEKLFNFSVRTHQKKNYLILPPPKSADPSLYHLTDLISINNETDFVDTLHTVEYFAGYVAAFSLKHIDENFAWPTDFVLFGGGWQNQISYNAFVDILNGNGFILPMHQSVFKKIRSKFNGKINFIFPSGGKYMEARLMADMAFYFDKKKAWTTPQLTGCLSPCVLGVKAEPQQLEVFDDLISRASRGWQFKLKK